MKLSPQKIRMAVASALLVACIVLLLRNRDHTREVQAKDRLSQQNVAKAQSASSAIEARRSALKDPVLSEVVAPPSSAAQSEEDRTKAPAHWIKGNTLKVAPVVPSGFKLSPAFAQTTIEGKDFDLTARNGKFDRLALLPEQEITVTVAWPTEHKIQQVAVQGVHGGTINGEIGQVLQVGKNGTFTFRFKPSRGVGHDEVVCSAANVAFTLPIWVGARTASAPATLNTIQ